MTAASIALVGNPNSGKTALFNRLTGSRQKVANYAGVTVERKEGFLQTPAGRRLRVLDLPGAYSFDAASPDEEITRDICLGRREDEPPPDLLVCVVDATNLRLHLRFVLELTRLGRPMLLALNMVDAARKRGIRIDVPALQQALGIPVVETIAVQRGGTRGLLTELDRELPAVPAALPADVDPHARVREVLANCVEMPQTSDGIDDALDRWLLHPVIGMVVLSLVMFLIFQAVFAWAAPMQDALAGGIAAVGGWIAEALPDGPLRSLVVEGIFAGLGTVVEFLPQILLLFLFILLLEESGYLPRAAFLLDRLMFAAGLTGRSFIPLLSSFACAIPGVMATRTIQDPRDRIATILVAPLMTCSARLPVYALLIGAFIPRDDVLGVFNLQGLVLFALYLAGVLSALAAAWVMKRWRRDRSEHALMMELPSYRLPNLVDVGIGLWERARIFLRRVTTIILSLTVLLWFLSSYPAPPEGYAGAAIDYSLAGRIGHFIQPIFEPIGFNWQICIALIPGLAAREVAVSALATVYAISASTDEAASLALGPLVAADWSLATALSLLVWYVYAPQCLSTLAVIRRETHSWRPTAIAATYLFGLAYLASLITYQLTAWLT